MVEAGREEKSVPSLLPVKLTEDAEEGTGEREQENKWREEVPQILAKAFQLDALKWHKEK